MRKLIMIVTLVSACFALAAAPAAAQRDPFDPVIDPNAATTGTTGPIDTTGSTGTDPTQPSVDSGVLSTTGSDPSPWLVVAYGLLVLGGTAVILARLHTPKPIRR
jgi:hypothetical protein